MATIIEAKDFKINVETATDTEKQLLWDKNKELCQKIFPEFKGKAKKKK